MSTREAHIGGWAVRPSLTLTSVPEQGAQMHRERQRMNTLFGAAPFAAYANRWGFLKLVRGLQVLHRTSRTGIAIIFTGLIVPVLHVPSAHAQTRLEKYDACMKATGADILADPQKAIAACDFVLDQPYYDLDTRNLARLQLSSAYEWREDELKRERRKRGVSEPSAEELKAHKEAADLLSHIIGDIGANPKLVAYALHQRCSLYRVRKEYPLALDDITRLISLAPTELSKPRGGYYSLADLYEYRKEVLILLGRLDEAWADFEKFAQLGGIEVVKRKQEMVTYWKFYTGPIDGIITPAFKDAMMACWKEPSRCST